MSATVSLVRSLYGDISTDVNGRYLFDDETVTGWIELAEGNPYRAAALACYALAADQNYLLKNIRTDDLSVNGTSVSSEFRQLGDQLSAQADKWDSDQDDSFGFVRMDGDMVSLTNPEAVPWPSFGAY